MSYPVPKDRPVVEILVILNPYWIAGFADGESCVFFLKKVFQKHIDLDTKYV